MEPKMVAKAIVATVVAFCGALGTALSDGVVTPVEWTVIASTTVAAGGLVWGVPNSDTK